MKAGRVVLEKGADDKQSSRGTNSEKQRICKGEGQSFFFLVEWKGQSLKDENILMVRWCISSRTRVLR